MPSGPILASAEEKYYRPAAPPSAPAPHFACRKAVVCRNSIRSTADGIGPVFSLALHRHLDANFVQRPGRREAVQPGIELLDIFHGPDGRNGCLRRRPKRWMRLCAAGSSPPRRRALGALEPTGSWTRFRSVGSWVCRGQRCRFERRADAFLPRFRANTRIHIDVPSYCWEREVGRAMDGGGRDSAWGGPVLRGPAEGHQHPEEADK